MDAGAEFTTRMAFRAERATDFEAVEKHVSFLLSADMDRSVAFIRSAPFCRFRVRALYRTREINGPLYGPNGIVLSFTRDSPPGRGGWVAVWVREDPAADSRSYDDSWQVDGDGQDGSLLLKVESGSQPERSPQANK
jgi:hypothetical protein